MDATTSAMRLEVRFDARQDRGQGEWVSSLFDFTGSTDSVAERGKAKRFEDALLAVANQVDGWVKPAITHDAGGELSGLGSVMNGHQDWALIAESGDEKWTVAFLSGQTVVGSFTHERLYEAVIQAFRAAVDDAVDRDGASRRRVQ